MTAKRRLSLRELWLVSLLPAALVVIVSLGLPGPSKEIKAAETRLDQITGRAAQVRMQGQLQDASASLTESREELAQLEAREAEIMSSLEELQAPRETRSLAMADAMDQLTRRLAKHGVRVLAMKNVASRSLAPTQTAQYGSGRKRRAAARLNASSSAASNRAARSSSNRKTNWQVSVAGTWPSVRAALADVQAFPTGLGLSALEMQPARPGTSLHRWELFVHEVGAP
ncbi:MAG: hypothetical protein AAF726_03700 [Planctomycetota bacterium]